MGVASSTWFYAHGAGTFAQCQAAGKPYDLPPTESEIQLWKQISFLPVGHGGRHKTVRSLSEFLLENVIQERHILEQIQDWKPCHERFRAPLLWVRKLSC